MKMNIEQIRSVMCMIGVSALLSCSHSTQATLTSRDQDRLHNALRRLGTLTKRPDLSFQMNREKISKYAEKYNWDYVKGSTMPDILIKPLEDPMLAPRYADTIAQTLLRKTSIVENIRNMASLRNIAPSQYEPMKPHSKDLKALGSLPQEVRHLLTGFITSATLAKRLCQSAFINLNHADKEQLAATYASFVNGGEGLFKEQKVRERLGIQHIHKDHLEKISFSNALKKGSMINQSQLATAAIVFADACEHVSRQAKNISPAIWDQAVKRGERTEIQTSLGLIVIGGRASTLHAASEKHTLLILDIGGNDSYTGAHGGANGITGGELSAVIDVEGDDVYLANQSIALGSGFFGIGLLIDLDGDDRYEAEHFSLGCGFAGWGILSDYSGDDWYRGVTHVEGAGVFGYGLLIDSSGADRYNAHKDSQAYGFTDGVGILSDLSGDDRYQSGDLYNDEGIASTQKIARYLSSSQGYAFAYRPDTAGGIACLLDGGGNDLYDCGQGGLSQGCAYWFSYGLLYDVSGNDIYHANYYSQGAGIHLATGLLIDRHGDDHYKLTGGGGQAWGHDYGVGILIDSQGNDRYAISFHPEGKGFTRGSGQGGGNINGIALLLDAQGNDKYETGPEWTKKNAYDMYQMGRTIGKLKQENTDISKEEIDSLFQKRRGIGILLDTEGIDNYTSDGESVGGNGTFWKRMYACIADDLD